MAIDDNTSYELTGYQVKDLAQKIRAKADSSSLASVATSGLYSDLIGTPTIPSVYNGKLTIQQDGVEVGTFTANQSSDATINLTGGGSTYTAGNGIDITNDVISIDDTVVAELSDIPTVNDATLTITQNGTSAGTFTANSSTDTTIALTDTTYSDFTGATSLADGDAGLVPKPLAGDETKFLSGNGQWTTVSQYNLPIASANDLGGIKVGSNLSIDSSTGVLDAVVPTVNDATLTIQKNGTTIDTFTANASSNKTINITVPTSAADVSALPASTKYGATFELSINSTTYVVTATLKDQDGNTLGTAQTIDLPLESVVVSGSYDSQTKEVVLTLQNGSSIRFSVADLVSGLQPTLTAGSNITIDSATNTISATDTTYSVFTGSTASADGTSGLVPQPLIADKDKFLKGDGTWSTTPTKLVEMSYGEANAWQKFIDAYNAGAIVYCRASSNANPATGSQTRKAFMAYVNDASNPTNVEFQYVRSVSSKTSTQPVDQVFVYKLTNSSGGTWTVESRNMAPKLDAGTNASVSYSNGTYTISATDTTYSDFTGATSSVAGANGLVPAPTTSDPDKYLKGDGTWETPPDTTYTDFIGADGVSAGTQGLVPAPAATDDTKFLKGDGTWSTVTATISPATTSTLGGVIVGNGISVANDGTISADTQAAVFTTNEWNAMWA